MKNGKLTFKKYLAVRRESKGWTFRELSKRSGVNISRLFDYEKGNTEPNVTRLRRIAKAYGQNLSQFLKPIS